MTREAWRLACERYVRGMRESDVRGHMSKLWGYCGAGSYRSDRPVSWLVLCRAVWEIHHRSTRGLWAWVGVRGSPEGIDLVKGGVVDARYLLAEQHRLWRASGRGARRGSRESGGVAKMREHNVVCG